MTSVTGAETEAGEDEPSLSCEGDDGGGIMKGLLCKAAGVTASGPAPAHRCEAIMMHEGPLHVYDMIVSDLSAPRGN